jgi:hypothetical protein
VNQPVVARDQVGVSGSGVFLELTCRCGRVRCKGGRLAEGAGGLIVNWYWERLPRGADENCRAGSDNRETCTRRGPPANPRHEERKQETQERPPERPHAIRVLWLQSRVTSRQYWLPLKLLIPGRAG